MSGIDDMLRRAIGEGVEIETVVDGGLWNTFIDPTQVENALLNLAINARDAMDGTGKLTIEAGNASLDDEYAHAHDIAAGQYVMLAVTDTGAGMLPEVIAQAFEPFFSTKPEGKGTGLGLSMVYGFVKQSGGHIRIYSEVGSCHENGFRAAGDRCRGGRHQNVFTLVRSRQVKLDRRVAIYRRHHARNAEEPGTRAESQGSSSWRRRAFHLRIYGERNRPWRPA